MIIKECNQWLDKCIWNKQRSSRDLKKEGIKYNNIIKHYKKLIKENIKEHSPNWLEIPDHLYRILIIGACWSGKTNSFFNLINQQPNIDKIYLYAKDPYEAIYQYLIYKRKSTDLKHFNDSKAFIKYWNSMDNVYKIFEYNPNKRRNILIVFDMIADMLSNKKLNPIVPQFIRGRKMNICLVLIINLILLYQKVD